MTKRVDQVFGIAVLPHQNTQFEVQVPIEAVPIQSLNSSIWDRCRSVGVTHLITLDPTDMDENDTSKLITALADVSRAEPEALVFGVPDGTRPPKPTTWSQRINRWRTDRWFRLLTACPVKNVWSGYRVYPINLLDKLVSEHDGAAWMFDVMVRGAWGGVPLAEIPLPISKPRPHTTIRRLRWTLFLRWLVILIARPQVLLQED
jgi:hypothetical protein